MSDSIIIIGAGIAGLAAGCYAQMNGYESQIFERHDLPGGLCTAWNRDGYTFDGCLHYLFGTATGQPFHKMWEELGATQGRTFLHHDALLRVVDGEGRALVTWCDPDRLQQHLHALSPLDAALGKDLAAGVHQFMSFDMSALQAKPRALMQPADWLDFGRDVLPFALPMAKWGTVSAKVFATRFRDPFLRRAIPHMFAWQEIPMMVGMSLLAYMQLGNAGFPEGGSLAFAQSIERRYLELGGVIHYNAQVERILVHNQRAVGVRLYDDSEHFADTVVSAADGHATVFDLLNGQYADRTLRERFDGRVQVRPQVQVSFGVAREMRAEPHWTLYLLDEPIMLAGDLHDTVGVKHYSFDRSLAPEGKSVIEIMFPSSYDFWHNVHSRKGYRAEKQELRETLTTFLESRYPGISTQIETSDVATPTTYERYTGNWQGSTCGWLLTDKTMPAMIEGMKKTLPGLQNFYMAGQWVEPGGSVPIVAMSGRSAIQLICHADGRAFTTAVTPVTAP